MGARDLYPTVSGDETLQVGFVGAGGVARRHVEVLNGFDDVAVVAVADPVREAAEELAAVAGGADVFADVDALLGGAAVEALYVCVPPFAHGPPEQAALAAGIPFFVEKPLSVDLGTAETIGAEVEQAALVTATGYHWRNLDILERARELMDGRPPRLAIASWLDKVPPVGWWTERARSGGQTVEQATHLLDVMLELLGPVDEVHAIGTRTPRSAFPHADVDDVSSATLRFRSGAVGSVVSSCLLGAKHRASVEIVGDGYVLGLTEDELTIDLGNGRETMRADGGAKTQVDRDFVDAVRAHDPGLPRAPYASALRTHQLACEIARSALEGRSIAV